MYDIILEYFTNVCYLLSLPARPSYSDDQYLHLFTGDSLLLYQAGEERPIPLLFRLCFRDHRSGIKVLAKEQTSGIYIMCMC